MKSETEAAVTSFRNNLRLLIERNGMSLQSFCEKIEIPSATISRYITGARVPGIEYVIEIARFFNVSVDWMLGLNEKEFDVMPQDIQDVVRGYSLASSSTKRIVRLMLSNPEDTES